MGARAHGACVLPKTGPWGWPWRPRGQLPRPAAPRTRREGGSTPRGRCRGPTVHWQSCALAPGPGRRPGGTFQNSSPSPRGETKNEKDTQAETQTQTQTDRTERSALSRGAAVSPPTCSGRRDPGLRLLVGTHPVSPVALRAGTVSTGREDLTLSHLQGLCQLRHVLCPGPILASFRGIPGTPLPAPPNPTYASQSPGTIFRNLVRHLTGWPQTSCLPPHKTCSGHQGPQGGPPGSASRGPDSSPRPPDTCHPRPG